MTSNIFKIKKFAGILLFSLMLVLPVVSLAQVTISGAVVTCTGNTIATSLCNIQKLLNSIVPVLLALGVVYFVWGVVQYVIAGGEEAKKKGRDHIIYGIIGFVVIVSLWGIVNVVTRTLGFQGQAINVPSLVPTTTAAQAGAGCTIGTGIQGAMGFVTCIIQNSVIPLMFALAIAFFIWGLIQYLILGAGEEAKRTQGRQHMIWGIIALAVMLGVWSLVGIVTSTFSGSEIRVLPGVKPSN